MAGEAYALQTANNSSCNSKKVKENKKKKNKRGGTKKKMTAEQSLALKCVREWVSLDQSSSSLTASSCVVDDFGAQKTLGRGGEKLVFVLHSHSKFSDEFLSPSKLVERAHGNGVKVLALTDHDTMSGVTEALHAA